MRSINKTNQDMWRDDMLDYIVISWEHKSNIEIAKHLNVPVKSLDKMVGKLRKAGLNLPVKKRISNIKLLIENCVKRHKNKK
jgi:transposase